MRSLRQHRGIVNGVQTANANLCSYLLARISIKRTARQFPFIPFPISTTSANILNALLPRQNMATSDTFVNNYRTILVAVSITMGDLVWTQYHLETNRPMPGSHIKIAKYPAPQQGCSGFWRHSVRPRLVHFHVPNMRLAWTAAHNDVLRPTLITNRAGFQYLHLLTSFGVNASQIMAETGLSGFPPIPTFAAFPLQITGFQGNGRRQSFEAACTIFAAPRYF